jgi:hypothetical protein
MMAIRDHYILLRQQMLDTILRDNVLHLKEREEAGAGAPPYWEPGKGSGGPGTPPPMAVTRMDLQGPCGKYWFLSEVGP